MAKYIFATKFKKIEKEPLYYNIQVSVDKDFSTIHPIDPGYKIEIYKDVPIVMEYLKDNISKFGFPQWGSIIDSAISKGGGKDEGQMWFYLCGGPLFCMCQDYDFYISEIIQVDHNGTIFTFTPIPVYEKENYNLEVLFDKDLRTYDIDGQIKDFEANSPIILNYAGADTWTYGNSLSFERKEDSYTFNGIDSNGNIQTYVSFPFNGIKLTDPYDAVNYTNEDGTTFKFTLVHIYE